MLSREGGWTENGSHFFSRANIQQCTMSKYSRMYSQNQISITWLVRNSNKMRIIMLHFGKAENFSVIQKEKYFNVCICYEKKNVMCKFLRFQMIIYVTSLLIHGGSENKWEKDSEKILRNIATQYRIQQFLGGCRLFDKRSEEKNRCAAGESGERCKPSPVGSRDKASENCGYSAFWIAQNIALVALKAGGMMLDRGNDMSHE